MKKKYLQYIFFAVIGCFIFFVLVRLAKPLINLNRKADEIYEKTSEPILGIYDRNEKMTSEQASRLRHFTIKWNNSNERSAVENQLSTILKGNQNILFTIELWAKKGDPSSKHGILQGTINGDYDKKIVTFCQLISTSQNTVYLRWNPEMEVPVRKYPWQSQANALFIDAFRHFSELCKKTAPSAKIVWGPFGYAGTLEYWPGPDVVDINSITLNNIPKELAYKYPLEESVPVQIKRKLHRLRFIDKPVLVLGSENVRKEFFNNKWLAQAVEDIRKDTAVVYSAKNFVRPGGADNKRPLHFEIGVYDPTHDLVNQKPVSVEHLFVHFSTLKDGTFEKQFDSVIQRKHDVIVTMEFWFDKKLDKDSNVLVHTIDGYYDPEIKQLLAIISNVEQTVYLRWGHEMEIPIDRYPWQSKDPATYIKAFRHFMSFAGNVKNIRRVWGPTGDRGALDWWPGHDVVDYISLAIYGLPDKNITDYKKQELFGTIFNRKFYRMRFVNKPVFITEFGVKGPQSFKKYWLEDAAATLNQNPTVIGCSYFNFKDSPKAWGDIEAPDWSITKETFIHFTQLLKR